MNLPEGYIDQLRDDLAPFGLEFASAGVEDGDTIVVFDTDPESFVSDHPGLGIAESYGEAWPPPRLQLWLKFDVLADPFEVSFEVFDVLAWAASADPVLRDRLNTLNNPADHAAAVAEALAALFAAVESEPYLD